MMRTEVVKQAESVPAQVLPVPMGQVGFQDFAEDEIDLRQYLRVLLKRKWLILAVSFTMLAGVAVETLTTVPSFKATVRIQIDPEASNVLPYKDVGETSDSYLASEAYLQTQLKVLQSRTLAARVSKRMNLAEDPAFNVAVSPGVFSRVILGLRVFVRSFFISSEASGPSNSRNSREKREIDELAELEVLQVRGTRLVDISYVSHDPQFAARLLNTLADEYIQQNFENKFEATTRATEFLQKQLLDLKMKVEKSEEDLVNYARAHNILNIDEHENIVVRKLADLNQEMTRVEAALIARTAQYEAIKGASIDNFPNGLRNTWIESLESRLFDSQQKLASLSTRFGPDWPEIIQAEKEISEIKEHLKIEKGEAIRRARLDYTIALDHQRRLSAALEDQKREAARLNEDSIQYNILKREVETIKQLYEGLLQRLKEAGVSAGLKSSNIRFVDAAQAPVAPFRPRTGLNLALGLVLGLMLGVGLAFASEFLDDTVKTPEEVEHFLHLPSLGIVPSFPEFATETTHKLLVETSERVEEHPVTFTTAEYRHWEAYRSLRTSLLLSSSGKPPRNILVSSALAGEGKTTTVINLGLVLAQTGVRTLLMDLDMRKPDLASRFGFNQNQGMSTYLSRNSDFSSQIRSTNVPNLFLLPAGMVPPNPAELIGSERMQNALELLSEHFRYIVIDSPPLLSVSDGLVLTQIVHGLVIVIHGGKTPRDAVKKASDRVLGVGGKILGTIVNNVNLRSSTYSYYQYYGDYYARQSA